MSEADDSCLPSQQIFTRLLKKEYPSLNVIVLAFEYPFKTSIYGWNKCQVIPFGRKSNTKVVRLFVWWKVWKKLNELNKKNDIKGILSFWCGECAFLGNRFSKRYGIVHKCWIMGQDAREGNKYIRRMNPLPGDLIAMSDFLQQTFYKNYHIKPAYVIPNGIDPDLFHTGHAKREIDILGAGSLIPLKQFDVFISIIREIKILIPAIRSVICGKGTQLHYLQEIIEVNGLKENITLMGEQSHSELLQIMNNSRIFLHPSNYEGFSTVCLEALYAGCQVMSFIKPMSTDIDHWYILKNEETMVQKALSILQDPNITYNPVSPYLMLETVKRVRELYTG